MKKLVLILIAITFFTLNYSFAQNKKSASSAGGKPWGLGIKLGDPSGFTLKHYMGANAWDLTLGRSFRARKYKDYYYESGGLSATFTYQWRKPFSSTNGLEWYYGIGGQVSSRRYYKRYSNGWYDEYDSKIAAGVVGVLGLEYQIQDTPIAIFGELTPYIELTPATLWLDVLGSVGGRIRF